LGNPGSQYARTRHNAGADAIALLAQRHGGHLKRGKEDALVSEVRIDDKRLALAFPQTYVNDSGRSVARLVRRFGIEDLTRLVIVHDELDLPLGIVRVKAGGGLAGHNGLRSVKAHLHSEEFTRIRIGIGKPPGGKEKGADHVLNPPARRDREQLDVSIEFAADAVEWILEHGVSSAQNRFNG
jgi:PTH1 family peptidyl-tRNA hydrolase